MSALLTVAITYILPKQSAEVPFMYFEFIALIFLVIFLCFLSVDRKFLTMKELCERYTTIRQMIKKLTDKL